LFPKEVLNDCPWNDVLPPKGDEPVPELPVPVFAEAVFVFPKEDLKGSFFGSSDPEEAEGLNAADVPKVNLGVDVVAALGVAEVILAEVETEVGVVGILKLYVEVPLAVFCWSEPKAPVSDEEEAEGRAVVEEATGRGFGVADLLGTLKVNFRGAFVDEDVVADGLGCEDEFWERLLFIKLLGLGTEKMPKEDGCIVGCDGVGLEGSGA
jgi:hypothetical protein